MNGKQGSMEKRKLGEALPFDLSGYCAVVPVPKALLARQREQKQILDNALKAEGDYVEGLKRIAVLCHLDEGELRKAYRDYEWVRKLIEKRGGRFRIEKARLIDLDLVLHQRRREAHQRGALHPSRKRGAHARFLRGSST